jgi:outer membrane protein assembly factor BamB
MKLTFKTLVLLIFLSVTLSACAGGAAATAASSWPGLTVAGDTAFLAYNQHVYAINIANGEEKWRFPSEADPKISFYAPPALTDDGQLLVGGYDHVLYSLDPQTGTVIWPFKGAKNRYIGEPLVGQNGIFAPNADRTLYALDFQGNSLWPYHTEGEQWAKPIADPACECIYLATMDHRIYAINALDGSEEWKTDDLGGSAVGTPAYGPEGTLFIGTFNSEMLAIDAKSGRILWQTPTDGWVWGGPAYKDGVLYFGDLKGSFYALKASNGEVLWKITPDGPIAQPPLLMDDTIYFTTEAGSIYALDYNSGIRWEQNLKAIYTLDDQGNKRFLKGKLYTSPAIAGDKILVAPTGVNEHLIALDMNGSEKSIWVFIPEKK